MYSHHRSAAFTLIELLVIVAIIAVLIAAACRRAIGKTQPGWKKWSR